MKSLYKPFNSDLFTCDVKRCWWINKWRYGTSQSSFIHACGYTSVFCTALCGGVCVYMCVCVQLSVLQCGLRAETLALSFLRLSFLFHRYLLVSHKNAKMTTREKNINALFKYFKCAQTILFTLYIICK